MANREIPVSPPRPVFETLPKAIAAFIADERTDRTKMLVQAWADTYKCGAEDVRREWEAQMSVKSQMPNNAFETPEGK